MARKGGKRKRRNKPRRGVVKQPSATSRVKGGPVEVADSVARDSTPKPTPKPTRKSTRKSTRKVAEPSRAAEPSWHEQPKYLLVAVAVVLALLGLLAYWNSLEVPFVLDDKAKILKETRIRPPVSLASLFSHGRPMFLASLAVNYALGGEKVFGYHLLNLLAHIGCGLLVFGFARYTLRLPVFEQRYERVSNHLALFAAALFLLHPVQTGAVTYVTQRVEVFVSIALLGGLWLAALVARAKSDDRRPLAGLVACCAFGLFSKESFAAFPGLLLVYDWCFLARGRLGELKRRWWLHALGIAVTVCTLMWVFAVPRVTGGRAFGQDVPMLTSWQYLTSQFGVLLYYVRLIFVPTGLCFDCGVGGPWPVRNSALGDMVVLPAIVLVVVAVAAWLLRRRNPLITFAVFGCAVLLAPTSSVMPLPDAYFEHRLYLCIALVALCVAALAFDASEALARRLSLDAKVLRIGRIVGAGALCATLLWLTVARNEVFADPQRLMEDTLAKAPESHRTHYNLANLHRRAQRYEESLPHYRQAIRLAPNTRRTYVNLADSYKKLGRFEEAVEVLETAHAIDPELGMVMRSLAYCYSKVGKMKEAIAMAEKSHAQEPDNQRGRVLLSQLYREVGRRADARRVMSAGGR